MLPLQIPDLGPHQATLYPTSGTGNVSGLPIPKAANRYFLTAPDAALALAAFTSGVQAFLNTQQEGQFTVQPSLISTQVDAELNSVDDFIGVLPENPTPPFQPVYEYQDKARTYMVYIIVWGISFRVPLPPNQPGPYNQPTVIGNPQAFTAIGDIQGSGTKVAVNYVSGNLTFSWA